MERSSAENPANLPLDGAVETSLNKEASGESVGGATGSGSGSDDLGGVPRAKPTDPPDAGEAPHREVASQSSAVNPEVPAHGAVFSPARALEAVGDRWSLLLYREAMFAGTTRFDDFQKKFDVASDVLDARLVGFVGAGLMELRRTVDVEEHFEYTLTPRGQNLEPVIIALSTWTDGWAMDPGPAVPFEHEKQIAEIVREDDASTDDSDTDSVRTRICLLTGFDFQVGGKSLGSLASGSQRLLAFLALHSKAVARDTMAGTMWPESTEQRAGISLRSALSRLDSASRNAILSASSGLSLVDTVSVDLREAQQIAHRLLSPSSEMVETDLSGAAVSLLSSDLLPDWYDDWVVSEAEDWRLLRMNALEAQSAALLKRGRHAAAAGSARAAIKAEPLRESATASLIRVHLAEGNQSDALRAFDRYRSLLNGVLGLEPTAMLTGLIAPIQRK